MWDTMVVNGQNCSGSTRPVNLKADGDLLFFRWSWLLQLIVFETLIEPAMYAGIQLSRLFTLRDRRWAS